tara:strand:- start:203 stop:406 length:204 start_codon:yes stop_codon:yes gene_type:complete
MNPDFVQQDAGETIICNIMEKKVKVILFILFMFFGVRQFLIFWDLWAGTFLCILGLTIILSKKEDVF